MLKKGVCSQSSPPLESSGPAAARLSRGVQGGGASTAKLAVTGHVTAKSKPALSRIAGDVAANVADVFSPEGGGAAR